MSELIKIKIRMEYEIVGRNVYGDTDLKKLAGNIFRANRNEIMNEALASNGLEFTGIEISTKKDLPKGYDKDCLPWMPSIPFGDRNSDISIGELLGKKR